MRKLGLLLLAALICCLSACGGQEAAGLPETPEMTVREGPVVSGGVLLPKGRLPQEGYASPDLPGRWYGDITLKLIPNSDYGRIWPYIGGYAAQMWMVGELYGLCDEDGKIVCDPVYNEVEILERDGRSLYQLTKNKQSEDYKNISKITLASFDGSWVKEYEGVRCDCGGLETGGNRAFSWRRTVDYEYITVCENGKWGVIDYGGKEVLPCAYNAPVCFAEGLAAVLSDDGKTYSFIDQTGAVVLGPYETPPRQEDPFDYTGETLPLNHGLLFRDGRVRFYENGKFGVIDREGNVIVPAQYDFITSYESGAAQFTLGEDGGILGLDGKVLIEPSNGWFSLQEDGTVYWESPAGPVFIDPKTGEEVAGGGQNQNFSCSGGSEGVVITWDGGELRFPDANDVVALENGNFALTASGRETWRIVDRSGETVAGPFEGRANYERDGIIYVQNDTDNYTSLYGYHISLYDEAGNRLLPGEYAEVMPFGGRYLVRQNVYAGLLDEDGNWVIRVPIYDYIGD